MKKIGLLLLFFFMKMSSSLAMDFPSFEQVKQAHIPSTAIILDRNGLPLQEIRQNFKVMQLEWLPLSELSPYIQEALLAAEDKRFFEHEGVDWRALAAATVQNVWYSSHRGASTLTMQLAGLLDPELAPQGSTRRSVGQKWDQTRAASDLESRWTKAQILEAYLNLVPFRGELRGVHAASWVLFNRLPQALDRPAAAVLAVLLRGPNAPADRISRRACLLLEKLNEPEQCESAERLAQQITTQRFTPRWALAPQLPQQIVVPQGGRVNSSLEAAWQMQARQWVSEQRAPLEREYAIKRLLILDNPKAEVLAYVEGGNLGLLTDRADRMLFPWVFASGLENRRFTLASLVHPSRNIPPAAPGWESVRTALAQGHYGALQPLLSRADWSATQKRLSAGLGGNWEGSLSSKPDVLAGLFRTLSVDGQWLPPSWMPRTSAGEPVRMLSAEASFLISDALAHRIALPSGEIVSVSTFQSGSSDQSVPKEATLVAWHEGVTAVMQASTVTPELVQSLAQFLADNAPIQRRTVPELTTRWVSFLPTAELPRNEYFLRGTETDHAEVALPFRAKIVSPSNGVVVDATPPTESLPPPSIQFSADVGYRADWGWQINGSLLGKGTRYVWRPFPGTFKLDLIQVNTGVVFDTVTFTVSSQDVDF